MKLMKMISVSLLLILMVCLTGCSKSPADTLNNAAGVSENTAVSAADMKVDESSVLWGVMYFYDEADDAICIVDNGRIITASVSEAFAMDFLVNGPYLFNEYTGTNFDYTYANDGSLYITFDEQTVYKYAQMTEEDFGKIYDDFALRFDEAMTNFAKENGYITEDKVSEDSESQSTTEVEHVEEKSTETVKD